MHDFARVRFEQVYTPALSRRVQQPEEVFVLVSDDLPMLHRLRSLAQILLDSVRRILYT